MTLNLILKFHYLLGEFIVWLVKRTLITPRVIYAVLREIPDSDLDFYFNQIKKHNQKEKRK